MRKCVVSERPKKHLKHGPIFWITAVSGVVAMVFALWFVDLKAFHTYAANLNGPLLFASMATLPLAGVPASVFYVVDGARFGHTWGFLVAGGAIAIQLVCYWWIAHSWMKNPLDCLFRRAHYHKPQIPEGEYVPVCLLVWLMPGVPYAAKNYLLALSGAPFRYFFWTGLPAHLVSASIGILFGDFIGTLSMLKIIFLVCYGLALGGLSLCVVRRLRARRNLSSATLKDEQ